MTNEKVTNEVVSIWGVIMLFLTRLVAPLPTANRWLSKMGESTNNLLSYGLANLTSHRLVRSLRMYQLSSY